MAFRRPTVRSRSAPQALDLAADIDDGIISNIMIPPEWNQEAVGSDPSTTPDGVVIQAR